jgi:hypothetical protein
MVFPLLVFRLLFWLMIGRYNLATERARQEDATTLQLLEKAREKLRAIEAAGLAEDEQRYLKSKVRLLLRRRIPAGSSETESLPPGDL